MAEFMVKVMVYDEAMNFIPFFSKKSFLGSGEPLGALPGGWEAADEQNIS